MKQQLSAFDFINWSAKSQAKRAAVRIFFGYTGDQSVRAVASRFHVSSTKVYQRCGNFGH